MVFDRKIKKIKMDGHRKTRTLTCPYCPKTIKVTLVNHLRKDHPKEWEKWTTEFVRVYNETNDLKRVMREFVNSEGQLILSWTVIDREIKRKIEKGGSKAVFIAKENVSRWEPSSEEYTRFVDTVWDVKRRGTWGVHQSNYRGNWAPQIPRAIMEMWSKPGDLVVDPFVGGGTTLLEAWALGRNAVGYDISDFAIQMTDARLAEMKKKATRESLHGLPDVDVAVKRGDARELAGLAPGSVDLVCAHPPYGDALQYSHDDPADLSHISDPVRFMDELASAGKRWYEVLKPGSHCAILIGDLRREGKLCTFGFDTLTRFRDLGFEVTDVIIKTQHQDRSLEFYYKSNDRLRLRHEYLLVFRKPLDVSPPMKKTRAKKGN